MNLLYWYKANHIWKKDITAKSKYEAAKHLAYFAELAKVFPLHIVQKREGK